METSLGRGATRVMQSPVRSILDSPRLGGARQVFPGQSSFPSLTRPRTGPFKKGKRGGLVETPGRPWLTEQNSGQWNQLADRLVAHGYRHKGSLADNPAAWRPGNFPPFPPRCGPNDRQEKYSSLLAGGVGAAGRELCPGQIKEAKKQAKPSRPVYNEGSHSTRGAEALLSRSDTGKVGVYRGGAGGCGSSGLASSPVGLDLTGGEWDKGRDSF